MEHPENQVEVLPPQPVGLDVIMSSAKPLMEAWSQTEIEKAKEETKRVQIRAETEKELHLKAMDNSKSASRQDFGIIAGALFMFAVVLIFGLVTNNQTIITNGLVAVSTFLGGFGTGRATKRKPD